MPNLTSELNDIGAESLEDVRRVVCELAERMGAGPDALPAFGPIPADADYGLRIEVRESVYDMIRFQRGIDCKSRSTADFGVFLYWVFRDMALGMATRQEEELPDPKSDFRCRVYARSEELLRRLDDQWADWLASEYDTVPEESPFGD